MKKIRVVADDRMYKKIVDFLIFIPIFDKLDAEDLGFIAKYMSLINVEKGETLFKEGDKGDFVCFVAEGALDVLKQNDEGKDVQITTLTKGRSLGEMSVIDNCVRSATVKAQTTAVLVTLSKNKFEAILAENCKAGCKILKGISRLISLNMRQTSSQLADFLVPEKAPPPMEEIVFNV